MPSYDVNFFKTLSDSTGHSRRVVQWSTLTVAATESEAAADAQSHFCALHGIPHWHLHADSLEVRQRASQDGAMLSDHANTERTHRKT